MLRGADKQSVFWPPSAVENLMPGVVLLFHTVSNTQPFNVSAKQLLCSSTTVTVGINLRSAQQPKKQSRPVAVSHSPPSISCQSLSKSSHWDVNAERKYKKKDLNHADTLDLKEIMTIKMHITVDSTL